MFASSKEGSKEGKEAVYKHARDGDQRGKKDGGVKDEETCSILLTSQSSPHFLFYFFFPGFSSNHRAAGAASDVTQPLSAAAESGCRPAEEQEEEEGWGPNLSREEGEEEEETGTREDSPKSWSCTSCCDTRRVGHTETPSRAVKTICSSWLHVFLHGLIKVIVQIFLSVALLDKSNPCYLFIVFFP